MDIEHFDPRQKSHFLQRYGNLFWACCHCNGKKGKRWPSDELQALGVRYLDCTAEQDYGAHIFEDPDTHEVFGVTPAGRYHVRHMDLNAEHLVRMRAIRADIIKTLSQTAVTVQRGVGSRKVSYRDTFTGFTDHVRLLKQVLDVSIPPIPYMNKPQRG